MRTSMGTPDAQVRIADTAAVADPPGARMAPLSAERAGRRGTRGERALCDRPAAAGDAEGRRAGPAPPDLAAEGFASLFARGYLTWNAAEPQAHESALAAFVGPGIEPGAGLQPPSSGEQRVEWAEVVQERELDSPPATPASTSTRSPRRPTTRACST